MAADLKSTLSRFITMLHSLARYSRRRVPAERPQTSQVSGHVAPEIDISDLEILQLAHDLRNQLMVMMSCVNAIRDGVPQERAQRLSQLHDAAERAVRLINSGLLVERPQHSEGLIVDLNAVVRNVVSSLAHFQEDAIRLRLDLGTEPLRVLAEPGDLERVLLNLVLNAFDAMPQGGVLSIKSVLAHAHSPIEGLRSGPYARLTITDTGCGMTPEVKARIFDAFFTTKKNGTGLGLYSAASTIAQLHGRISVESELGHGTSVAVMLPLATGTSLLSFPPSSHDWRD
jgi:two-component system cell cycle sensor histidine kinase/response regulator CckA